MEIARIVGAHHREDGYYLGSGYAVTWAYGHLLEICGGPRDSWKAPLPILPESFSLRVGRRRGKDGKMVQDPGYTHQLSVIGHLFSRSDYIINAGDAGREGELIQRYIYTYVGASAPVRRLWISSLTDEAIREGLRSLRPSSEFDNLYLAGKARSEADWLIGVNATIALTRAGGDGAVKSLGRVQTPTLALVCRRFLENRDFRPETFYRVELTARFGSDTFSVRSAERFLSLDDYAKASGEVRASGRLRVDSVEKKTVSQAPPLLHDLTSLQREANRRLGLSAAQTLSAAQALYEAKLISYPRTGSRYITEDVYRTLPGLLGRLAVACPSLPVAEAASGKLSRRSVSDGKVTDHHALLPTGNHPESYLPAVQRSIYELIVIRLLEALGEPCELLSTTVSMSSGGYHFPLKGTLVLEKGWRSVRGEDPSKEKKKEEDDGPSSMPSTQLSFHEGDVCPIIAEKRKDGVTKPRPLYTEDSLLEAMEHAGREVSDKALQEALKDCGLGTPATRAGEIETLLQRGYVIREKKSLVPTRLGLSVYDAVKDKSIADVAMTARWEKALADIAEGRGDVMRFDAEIRHLASSIVREIGGSGDIASGLAEAETLPGASCPMCGRAVMLTTRLARCVDDNCGWKIWRTIAGRTLTERELSDLLGEGRLTKELGGFRSRSGKSFSACVRLGADGGASLEFPDRTKDPEGNTLCCPRCHEPVMVRPNAVSCTDEGCGWVMWRQVAGKQLSDQAVLRLLRGQSTGVMKGFKSKSGKSFDAALSLDGEGKIAFSFPKKLNLKKKNTKW